MQKAYHLLAFFVVNICLLLIRVFLNSDPMMKIAMHSVFFFFSLYKNKETFFFLIKIIMSPFFKALESWKKLENIPDYFRSYKILLPSLFFSFTNQPFKRPPIFFFTWRDGNKIYQEILIKNSLLFSGKKKKSLNSDLWYISKNFSLNEPVSFKIFCQESF